MKTGVWILIGIGSVFATSAFAWNANYECVSNDAKKMKVTVSFLDAEVLRTREPTGGVDRYYRVTDSGDDLVEAMILGTKSGAAARLVPVLKGTMNLTMTHIDATSVTASVKVGKVVQTFSCK
jgi:hypothetical protein